MKKILALVLAASLVMTAFTACGKEEPQAAAAAPAKKEASKTVTPTEAAAPAAKVAAKTPAPTSASTPDPTATAAPTPAPTGVPLDNINPFTGEAIEKDVSGMRPYIFMCNNISVAVPHVGVAQSDLIMEMMEEGGITRMMVFYADPSDVPKIGSIRSARAYNIDTAMGYDAFLAHCGSSDEGDEMIAAYGMQDLDQISGRFGEDSFYRDPVRAAERGSEHSLFAVGGGCVNMAQAFGYRMQHEDGYDCSYGLSFSDDAAAQCTGDANQISVIYAGGKTSDFTYVPDENVYYMYQYGEEYTDDYQYRVPFANVIMIYANTYLQSDGQHLTIDLTNGSGYFFTRGKVVPILWYKDGVYDVFHYTLEDGTPLQWSKGRTFIAVNQSGSYQGGIEFS